MVNITVYRAIRPDELDCVLEEKVIKSRCYPCPGKPCCNISISSHINSGTKAKMKSRFISGTTSEEIAAIWSSTTSGTSSPLSKYSCPKVLPQ